MVYERFNTNWKPLLMVLVFGLIAGCDGGKQDKLFDGETFLGWEGNMDYFRIEEGAIVAGKTDEFIPRNEFLCTELTYENFELTLKAKMHPDSEGDNAGIQFRSQRIPDHNEVIGYQCDMGSDPSGKIWGYLYDESRRRKFLFDTNNQEMMAALRPNDWNDFVVRAEGTRIQIWLNGYQTVDYTEEEPDMDRSGVICLQIHAGPAAEAWYKDIQLVRL